MPASESFWFCLFSFLFIFGFRMVYIQHSSRPPGALPRTSHHFNACLVGGGGQRAPALFCQDLFLTARAHFAAFPSHNQRWLLCLLWLTVASPTLLPESPAELSSTHPGGALLGRTPFIGCLPFPGSGPIPPELSPSLSKHTTSTYILSQGLLGQSSSDKYLTQRWHLVSAQVMLFTIFFKSHVWLVKDTRIND